MYHQIIMNSSNIEKAQDISFMVLFASHDEKT